MGTTTGRDPVELDRKLARTTAIGLGVWLLLTFAAVGFLLLFGDAISGLFI